MVNLRSLWHTGNVMQLILVFSVVVSMFDTLTLIKSEYSKPWNPESELSRLKEFYAPVLVDAQ